MDKVTIVGFELFLRQLSDVYSSDRLSVEAKQKYREHHKNTYDIDEAALDGILRSTAAYVQQMKQLDARAETIIKKEKQIKNPKAGSRDAAKVGPPPVELINLQTQKERLSRNALALLYETLGPAQVAYLRQRIRSQMEVQPVVR